jgi:transketolase
VTHMIAGRPGPAYLRLGRAGEPILHSADLAVAYGKAILLREGHDLAMISIGGMLANTLAAADNLNRAGYSVRVLSMPFAVPLDEDAIRDAAADTSVILTVEEHGPGGLGSAVGECIARSGQAVTFVPLRLGRSPIKVAGSQEQLRAMQGLSADAIARSAEKAFLHQKSISRQVCQ